MKTPMSVYLTLEPCAISTSLISSCSLAFTASEYDGCGHRRCWTAASCRYYSSRRRPKPVGLVLPCVYCCRTRCCALWFVDDDGRAIPLFFFCNFSNTAADTASEYDSCGHRRCWTAAASCHTCIQQCTFLLLMLLSLIHPKKN